MDEKKLQRKGRAAGGGLVEKRSENLIEESKEMKDAYHLLIDTKEKLKPDELVEMYTGDPKRKICKTEKFAGGVYNYRVSGVTWFGHVTYLDIYKYFSFICPYLWT